MIIILVIIFAIVCLAAAYIGGSARLLNQCLDMTIPLALVFLLVPGLNVLGMLLLIVAGFKLLIGKCKSCVSVNRTISPN